MVDFPALPGESSDDYFGRAMRHISQLEGSAVNNRNYFERPDQGGGRGAYDYGRTGKIGEPRTIDLTWLGFSICVAALGFVGAAFVGWI